MKHLCLLCAGLTLASGGCPQDLLDGGSSGVFARIGVSSQNGDPPLTIAVSAADSVSSNGRIVRYDWDFGGQATADTMEALHTFTQPGRYSVVLRVWDETGADDAAFVDIRVRGGPVVPAIQASAETGPAPLIVNFDGSASTAESDMILDYFWDFGDGGDARQPTANHRYIWPGTYTVELRAVSAGGVSGTAQLTITVTPREDAGDTGGDSNDGDDDVGDDAGDDSQAGDDNADDDGQSGTDGGDDDADNNAGDEASDTAGGDG
ncbi:MAG: PKD domain-containing protein [Planctomycetes bacterium]|nr:PKD domain-containing protein [Planctomycetota bacterium]